MKSSLATVYGAYLILAGAPIISNGVDSCQEITGHVYGFASGARVPNAECQPDGKNTRKNQILGLAQEFRRGARRSRRPPGGHVADQVLRGVGEGLLDVVQVVRKCNTAARNE